MLFLLYLYRSLKFRPPKWEGINMEIVINLNSFWVGFVAGWASIFVISGILYARRPKDDK